MLCKVSRGWGRGQACTWGSPSTVVVMLLLQKHVGFIAAVQSTHECWMARWLTTIESLDNNHMRWPNINAGEPVFRYSGSSICRKPTLYELELMKHWCNLPGRRYAKPLSLSSQQAIHPLNNAYGHWWRQVRAWTILETATTRTSCTLACNISQEVHVLWRWHGH